MVSKKFLRSSTRFGNAKDIRTTAVKITEILKIIVTLVIDVSVKRSKTFDENSCMALGFAI